MYDMSIIENFLKNCGIEYKIEEGPITIDYGNGPEKRSKIFLTYHYNSDQIINLFNRKVKK